MQLTAINVQPSFAVNAVKSASTPKVNAGGSKSPSTADVSRIEQLDQMIEADCPSNMSAAMLLASTTYRYSAMPVSVAAEEIVSSVDAIRQIGLKAYHDSTAVSAHHSLNLQA